MFSAPAAAEEKVLNVFNWADYIGPTTLADFEAEYSETRPDPLVNGVLILVGLGMLVVGSNLLLDAAVAFAEQLGVSDLVIGLTVVAFGTSTPELFVNIVASARGNSEIAIGNVRLDHAPSALGR